MAYSTSSPPSLVAQGIGSSVGATANAGKLWLYMNTDAVTAVRVSGYFTNGYSLGMRKGDLLFYVKTDASPLTIQAMIVNESTKSGATETVDLSDGLAITSTDSD